MEKIVKNNVNVVKVWKGVIIKVDVYVNLVGQEYFVIQILMNVIILKIYVIIYFKNVKIVLGFINVGVKRGLIKQKMIVVQVGLYCMVKFVFF